MHATRNLPPNTYRIRAATETPRRAPIDQRTDPVSRYVRVLPPVLCAIGGDASKITPDIATDVLLLLGEWEHCVDAESPVVPQRPTRSVLTTVWETR